MDHAAFELLVWGIVAGLVLPCIVAIIAMIAYLRMLPGLHRAQMRALECSAPPPYLR